VIGFDDQAGSNSTIPPLTTLSLQGYEQGRQATEMLLTVLEGKPIPQQVTVPPKLVIRQSCGCVNPTVAQAAAGPMTVKDEPLEMAMSAQLEKMLLEMRQAAEIMAEGLDSGWAEQLLEAFLAELKAEASGVFLSTLDGILRQVIAAEGQVAAWANVISTLRRRMLPHLDNQILRQAEDLWLQAQVMVGETAQQAQRAQAAQMEQQTQILNEIRAALITTFDVEALMDTLAQELPRLDIPSCYLALYENPQRPTEMSRLALAYDKRRGRLEPGAGQHMFPSRQLVPEGMLPQARRYSLVVEALYFREEQLGFALFEVGPRDGPIYDLLRGEISSALQGARITQQAQHRTLQLQTGAEVSRVATSILDPDELIQRVANLACERFNLYYAGLFLVDQTGEWTSEPGRWAVLRAGTGEAGGQMMAQGHKLEIGGASMIGWCIANQQARIALDVGEDAVRFENPLLPETRSEMALPLVSRGHVLGAMTIQSDQLAAFSQEDVTVLQTMADQLANAIENARLFAGRKQAEEALIREQYVMNALMANVPDYIYFKDMHSRFIRTTQAHARAFGLNDPAQVVGKTDFDFFTEEHARPAFEAEQEIIRTGQPVLNLEERETWPDHPDTWVSTTKMPLRDENGNIIGTFGISRDITDRKQAEEALASERNLLRALIDNLPDYVFAKDAEGRFVVGNTALARHMGAATPDDLIGKTDFDFYPQELATRFYADEQALLQSGQSMLDHEEATRDPAGNPSWTLTTKVLLHDSQGKVIGLAGASREITGHKQAEAERERLLAEVERRALQLQTAAEVSHAASSILNPDELLPKTVDLIRERFNLYYVGLFLVDESGQSAVLRAGTGEAGQKMIAASHQLEVGGSSMIGWCITNRQARVTLDVTQDAVHFKNPLLPETRSELALPLVSRGQVMGALTIQSSQPAAFTQDDISVLETLSSQVANAIENSRLFEQTQVVLKEMEATQRRYLQKAWADYLPSVKTTHYEVGLAGTTPMDAAVLPEIQRAVEQRSTVVLTGSDNTQESAHSALVTPITLRGNVIGVLGIHGDKETRQWSAEEVALVEAVTERLAQAAENLRLFDETQRRAAREQLIAEITSRVRNSTTLEAVLNSAVREIGQMTSASFAAIDLELPEAG
jgi:PAS domain S-box-containing protein